MRRFAKIVLSAHVLTMPAPVADEPATASPAPVSSAPATPMTLRHMVDLVICLIVTVVCVRAFVIEGYMISTGSMAPGLLGFHKRVVCPRCDTTFELGVAFDDDDASLAGDADSSDPPHCQCPNCGQPNIEVKAVPRNQGDQLLVHKNAYLFRHPDRWEVVVFLNPSRAMEAFVKRVLGLPGERIQLRDGDVFVNGERIRKTLPQVQATELTVYDDRHRPQDADWKSRWSVGRFWEQTETGFRTSGSEKWSWVRYRHWLRTGGRHRTSVSVPAAPLAAAHRRFSKGDGFPFVVRDRIEFDEEQGVLTCRGVMGPELQRELREASGDPEYQRAVGELAVESHFAPITDQYGYNTDQHLQPVRDIGVQLTLTTDKRSGEFVIQLRAPDDTFECVLNLDSGMAGLFSHARSETVRSGAFAPSLLSTGAVLAVRHVDQQILVTLGDELLLDPYPVPTAATADVPGHEPIAFAARNADVGVENVRITRDIHYTRGRARNGVTEEFTLGDEEYFVLGDNSPVSSDSRNWEDGAIHQSYLIGKPIVVHLPSSPRALKLRGDKYLIRIPEFSRIRPIR